VLRFISGIIKAVVASSTGTKLETQYRHFISLIPIAVAIGYIFGIFSVSLTEAKPITLSLATFGSALLYGVAIYSAQSLKNNLWQGYVHLASGIALLTTGLANSLYIIIGVSIVVALIKYSLLDKYDQNTGDTIADATGWISLSGITVISEYLIFTVIFNQNLPYTALSIDTILVVVLTLAIGNVISVIIGGLITQQPILRSFRHTLEQSPPLFELLLLFVAGIIAAVLYQVNELTFLVIIGFAIAQVLYGHRSADLEKESKARLEELTVLSNMAQSISVQQELDQLLNTIHSEINQLVDADIIFVAFYDKDQEIVNYPLVMENGKPIRWHDRRPTRNLTDYVIRNSQILSIRKDETARLKQLGIELDMIESRAYVGIPMMVGEKTIGVIGLLNMHHTDILGNTSMSVIQSIVDQASLAIRNTTLFDRTKKLAGNLAYINQSVQDVMFNLNRDDAMQAATKTAQSITQADKVAIFLVDMQDKLTIRLAQFMGASDTFGDYLKQADPSWFDSATDSYRQVYDVNELKNPSLRELALVGEFQAFVEVPMRSGTTIVGYLVIYHDNPHQYTALEIELLEMLTSQITVALDNAELLQALEVYASEQAELVHLNNISSSSLELESVITDVSKGMSKMLKVDRVEIGLYVQGHSDIHVYVPQNDMGFVEIEDYQLDEFPELQINRDNMLDYPIILLNSDNTASPVAQTFMESRHGKMLTIVPLFINNEVIGAIIISDSQERIFRDNERRLIEMATSQIAAQIHNAKIHTLTQDALVKRLEQLALIEDIGQKTLRSLDLDLIIDNVLEAAVRSTSAEIAILALLQDDNIMSIKCHILNDDEIVAEDYICPVDDGIIGQVIRSGVMQMIDADSTLSAYIPVPHRFPSASCLVVPLIKGKTVIGALAVGSIYPSFFTDEHAGFIKSLAGYSIIAIDNASLLGDSRKQITALTQLRTLALEASHAESTSVFVNTVIKTAIEMMNGSGGILIPYDVDNKSFPKNIAGWIRLGKTLAQDVFFIPETLLYQAIHTEQVILVDDVDSNERYQSYEQIGQVDYQSIAIIPIERRSQVAELLCIVFKKPRTFVEQDRNTIQLLQVQLANHIDGVMLSEEIRESNVRMRAILDSTRDGIILLDSDGRVQDANTSAEQLLNIDLTRFRNENFAALLLQNSYSADDTHGYAELIKSARATYAEPERNHIREYTLHANGRQVHIREVSSPVWGEGDTIIGRLLSLRDVTEERTLEEFRSRLQSMIVHDLRGPLGAIVSSMVVSEDILNKSEDEKLRNSLVSITDVAKTSANDMMELVDSMLDIGKMQRSEMDLELTETTVSEVAATAYMSLMASFTQAKIAIDYDIPEDLPSLHIDERLVGRVFINLIQNALKYTPKQGTIRVTARMSDEQEKYILVMVSDTGPGIPEDKQEDIFGQYFTIDSKQQKQQRGPRGTGLGLTFCKLVVEQHGGHIHVDNNGPLSGATFYFTLPTV